MFCRIEPPEDGVYVGVDFETYLTWDCFSYSMGKHLLRSPKHLLANYGKALKKKNVDFGNICETVLLEPEKISSQFGFLPETYTNKKNEEKPFDLRSPVCRKVEDNIREQGLIPLNKEIYNKALKVKKEAFANEYARSHIEDGIPQVSFVWTCETFGIKCKARFDLWNEPVKDVTDLKMTNDASFNAFRRNIGSMGYHLQAALYTEAAEWKTKYPHTFTFLAIENEEPYGIKLYTLREQSLYTGRNEILKAKAIYKDIIDLPTEKWCGYDPDPEDIDIPAYMIDQQAGGEDGA